MPLKANLAFLTPFEGQIMEKANAWLKETLWVKSGQPPAPPTSEIPQSPPVGKLLILCMTPRSGSTALSAALSDSKLMGRSGERLGNGPLKRTIEAQRPASLVELLRSVIEDSRTRNGVAQIKCDLPQLLPFLLDAACLPIIQQAQMVYLTREDILGQAISRYRGFQTGLWHSTQAAAPTGNMEVPYDFAAIKGQIDRLVQMMAAYERLFAALSLQPIRISYEQVTQNSQAVMARIAEAMQITLPEGASLENSGHTKVATRNNDQLRARYLAECQAMLHGAAQSIS